MSSQFFISLSCSNCINRFNLPSEHHCDSLSERVRSLELLEIGVAIRYFANAPAAAVVAVAGTITGDAVCHKVNAN